MATIEKRRGNWCAKVRTSGSSLSKTFSSKADALRWAVEIERSVRLGFSSAVDQRVTFGQVLRQYAREITPLKKGASVEEFRVRVILRHELSNTQLSSLNPHHIAKYRDDRLKHVAPSTVRRELTVISHALEGDDKLKIIAHELLASMQSNAVIDWHHSEMARARIRVAVKRILKRYGYPPDL